MNLEKEQDKLREERNKLQDKINLIQKEIDEIEIKKYKVENFLNKYIRIVYDNTITIMYVKKVERLFFGPKFIGPRFGHYLFSSECSSLCICKDTQPVPVSSSWPYRNKDRCRQCRHSSARFPQAGGRLGGTLHRVRSCRRLCGSKPSDPAMCICAPRCPSWLGGRRCCSCLYSHLEFVLP